MSTFCRAIVLIALLAPLACIAAKCSGQSTSDTPAVTTQPPAQPAPSPTGPPAGRKIAYLVDTSGSMTDAFPRVKGILQKCAGEVRPSDSLYLVLFSAEATEPLGHAWTPGTEEGLRRFRMSVQEMKPAGKTNPSQAIRLAFSMKPDVMYLLSDGEMEPKDLSLISRLNKEAKVPIHTFGLVFDDDANVQIAKESGGTYKYISDDDLASTPPAVPGPAAEETPKPTRIAFNLHYPPSWRIVFVVDRSASMAPFLPLAKAHIARELRRMQPDCQFQVIFFSDGAPAHSPAKILVPATEAHKRTGTDFMGTVTASGGSDPSEALKAAFALKPDWINLLSDGDLDPDLVKLVAELNKDKEVQVCTRWLNRGFDFDRSPMATIAAQNDGEIKILEESELTEAEKAHWLRAAAKAALKPDNAGSWPAPGEGFVLERTVTGQFRGVVPLAEFKGQPIRAAKAPTHVLTVRPLVANGAAPAGDVAVAVEKPWLIADQLGGPLAWSELRRCTLKLYKKAGGDGKSDERQVRIRLDAEPAVEFFGIRDAAERVVFISDRSGSMTDSVMYVKYELKRCVKALNAEQKFSVLFMSSGKAVELDAKGLVPAVEGNKAKVYEFIDSIVPTGQTDPDSSLKRAFELKPEVIYILSDGEFDKKILKLAADLNGDKAVRIHAIQFLYNPPHGFSRQLAEDNGGQYRYVSEDDLEAMFPSPKPSGK